MDKSDCTLYAIFYSIDWETKVLEDVFKASKRFLGFILILKSYCKLISKYVIAKVDLKVGVDSRAGASPNSGPGKPNPEKPGPRKPKVVECDVLAGLLLFVVIPVSYAIALLGVENLSSSLELTELHGGFF